MKCRFRCGSVSRAPTKQDDAAASMTFSTMFGSVANCVINVNVGGQAPKQLNTHCVLCMCPKNLLSVYSL